MPSWIDLIDFNRKQQLDILETVIHIHQLGRAPKRTALNSFCLFYTDILRHNKTFLRILDCDTIYYIFDYKKCFKDKFLSSCSIWHFWHSSFSHFCSSTKWWVSRFCLCFSQLQFFLGQELVKSVSFSEDFDAVLSRFESVFYNWGFFECPDFQIAESGDEEHASREKNDVKN